MISSNKFTLDAKNKKITFCGECTDVCDVCEAICCRTYDVTVTEEERDSGRYDIRYFCATAKDECRDRESTCFNRRYALKRRTDGSCIYLDENNKCSIHDHKPQACREFKCDNGWQISFAYQPADPGYHEERKKIVKRCMMEMLKDDMRFVMDPGGGVKAVFYSPGTKELVMVKKPLGSCAPFSVKSPVEPFSGGDELLVYLTGLLDGERSLGEIRRMIEKRFHNGFSREELYGIIWALYCSGTASFKSGADILRTKREK